MVTTYVQTTHNNQYLPPSWCQDLMMLKALCHSHCYFVDSQ